MRHRLKARFAVRRARLIVTLRALLAAFAYQEIGGVAFDRWPTALLRVLMPRTMETTSCWVRQYATREQYVAREIERIVALEYVSLLRKQVRQRRSASTNLGPDARRRGPYSS